MRNIRGGGFGLAVGLAVAAAACGSSEPTAPSDDGRPKIIDVQTWLVTPRDEWALTALTLLFRRRHPDIQVRSEESEGARHDPPDALSLYLGSDFGSWLEKGSLASLDATAATEGWSNVFPKAMLDAASKSGALHGVPLGVWRDNTLFYNKEVFAAFGVAAPSSFAEVLAAASAFDAKGMKAISMSSTGWLAAPMLFDSILVAQAGPDFHEAYFAGRRRDGVPELRGALTDFAKLLDYANADRATVGIAGAARRLCSGEAAMLLMGDFAKDYLDAGCLTPQKIGYLALEPAGQPTFVFAANAMVLPMQATLPAEATKFLEVVGSREAQHDYNQIEGRVPARVDADLTDFDFVSIQGANDLRAAGEHTVLDYGAAASEVFQGSANTALERFADPSSADHKNVEAVMTTLENAYLDIRP